MRTGYMTMRGDGSAPGWVCIVVQAALAALCWAITLALVAGALWLACRACNSHGASLTLAWDAPTNNVDGTPLTDLAGYKVYWGTNSRAYYNTLDVGNVTTSPPLTIAVATPAWPLGVTFNRNASSLNFSWSVCPSVETRWYFAATAYNTNLYGSDYSAELLYTLPNSPTAYSLWWGLTPAGCTNRLTADSLTLAASVAPSSLPASYLYVTPRCTLSTGTVLTNTVTGFSNTKPTPPGRIR